MSGVVLGSLDHHIAELTEEFAQTPDDDDDDDEEEEEEERSCRARKSKQCAPLSGIPSKLGGSSAIPPQHAACWSMERTIT